ncbi:MAG: hypothetical protein NVSMB56_14700 [Pyrinomonadaceae bacterium]
MRILIVRLGSIGDIVHALPALAAVRRALPSAEISWAVETRAAVAVNLSLKGFYELAKRAQIYVGGDTGPTHLAIAAKTPIVGLYGPTEWWRNGSPRAEDICVDRMDIGCREDCNRRTCDKWICMDIEVMRVTNAVTERLKRANEAQTKFLAREAF